MTPARRARACRPRIVADEQGAVLIQVGVALVVLIGFAALAIDYGVLWVSRQQAQNAADAGALAAATALAFDDMIDPTSAEQNARAVGGTVAVWGKPGVVQAEICADPSDPSCPTVPGLPSPEVRSSFSATVSVYRDQDHGNTLPTYLAHLFGVTSQGVRAQATATVAPANIATCVWPLAIPDDWIDQHPAETALPAQFQSLCPAGAGDLRCKPYSKYKYPGGGLLDSPVDQYVAPSTSSDDFTPTGYQLLELQEPMSPTGLEPQILVDVLRPDPATGAWTPARRSLFAAVRVGGGSFSGSLTSCNQQPVHIGDVLPLEPTPPAWSEVTNAAAEIAGLDSGATWDTTALRARGSCAATGACGGISPRLVLIPMFDPDRYDATRLGAPECGGMPCIKVVNFVGFFIDSGTGPAQLVGHLTVYPGRDVDTTGCPACTYPFVGYKWAFLRTAVLTR